MPVIAARSLRSRTTRHGAVAVVGIGIAAALTVATLSNPRFARAIDAEVGETIQSVKTVAAMLTERSPGERPEGALANLKPKRQPGLHERALPKIRGPLAPPTVYEALVGTPPNPFVTPPPTAPLYNNLAGGPPETIPPTGTPGSPGGPPILSNIPPPGGGGGFSPPVTQATPEVPVTPVAPVPEPGTWATMLFGFALIGLALRHRRAAGPEPASG